jgi:hypothetical protein
VNSSGESYSNVISSSSSEGLHELTPAATYIALAPFIDGDEAARIASTTSR